MENKVIWSEPAKLDLERIYQFYISMIGEDRAFNLVTDILDKTELLTKPVIGSTRFVSQRHPEIPYEKLVHNHQIIIFRKHEGRVIINRVFDTRQNPDKLKDI